MTFQSEHVKTRTHSGLRCIANTFFQVWHGVSASQNTISHACTERSDPGPSRGIFIGRAPARWAWPTLARRGVAQSFFELRLLPAARHYPCAVSMSSRAPRPRNRPRRCPRPARVRSGLQPASTKFEPHARRPQTVPVPVSANACLSGSPRRRRCQRRRTYIVHTSQ